MPPEALRPRGAQAHGKPAVGGCSSRLLPPHRPVSQHGCCLGVRPRPVSQTPVEEGKVIPFPSLRGGSPPRQDLYWTVRSLRRLRAQPARRARPESHAKPREEKSGHHVSAASEAGDRGRLPGGRDAVAFGLMERAPYGTPHGLTVSCSIQSVAGAGTETPPCPSRGER